MNIRPFLLLILSGIAAGFAQSPETPPKHEVATLPPLTMVELQYHSAAQKGAPTSPAQSTFVYKGQNSRIATHQWADSRITYDVRVQKMQFFTDPTAAERFKDYVQAVSLPPDGYGAADFPELNFVNEKASVLEGKVDGKVVWLITAPPGAPRYTDEFIKEILAKLGTSPEKDEIQKNLREAQKAEARRLTRPPNRVWIDPQTRLPLRAEVDGTTITYTYKPSVQLPPLPAFITEALVKTFGKMPQL